MLKLALLIGIASFALGVPDGFVKLGSKYFIYPTTMSFLQAYTFCQYYNMKMPIVPTKEVNDELYALFSQSQVANNYYWIAGVYQNNIVYKGWSWVPPTVDFNYTDWDSDGDPKYGGDNCIRFAHFDVDLPGLWVAGDCSDKAGTLCELS